MTANPTTVIIGGVAGGMSTATRLRRNDEKRNIIVLEASGHVSFANCGLPYHIGGVIEERQDLLLQTPEALKERFNIDVRVNTRATHVDRAARTVTTESGETIPYDDLVLSPGATPFLPPITGIEKAYSLRTVEDVDRIAAALKGRTRAVIIGGGFIGLEMAENLRHRDLSVAVVEATPQIMGPLDSEMAAIVTEHLRANGVEIRTNAQATEISDSGVALADGTELPADIVITAIGVRPASDLAREAGLEISSAAELWSMRSSAPATRTFSHLATPRPRRICTPAKIPSYHWPKRPTATAASLQTSSLAGKPPHCQYSERLSLGSLDLPQPPPDGMNGAHEPLARRCA